MSASSSGPTHSLRSTSRPSSVRGGLPLILNVPARTLTEGWVMPSAAVRSAGGGGRLGAPEEEVLAAAGAGSLLGGTGLVLASVTLPVRLSASSPRLISSSSSPASASGTSALAIVTLPVRLSASSPCASPSFPASGLVGTESPESGAAPVECSLSVREISIGRSLSVVPGGGDSGGMSAIVAEEVASSRLASSSIGHALPSHAQK